VSPEYTARQQYVPTAVVFVAASDVACPPLKVFALPTCVPAGLGHPAAVTSFGWHRKNATVPVGVGCPAPPVTVAVSVTDVPGVTLAPVGLDKVAVPDGCLATVKHSLAAFV
jgi:hypothetical protein